MSDQHNSLCMFSFIKENDELKPIVCRHPINQIGNERLKIENDSMHLSQSVSNMKELTFLMKLKIVNESAKMQLFKQGTDNLNGVIDAYIENSILKLKIYYNFRGRNSIKLEKIEIQLPDDFKNDYHTLCISISSRNLQVNFFKDSDFLCTRQIRIDSAINNSINEPHSLEYGTNHLIVDNEYADFKYFGVFSNTLTPLTYSGTMMQV